MPIHGTRHLKRRTMLFAVLAVLGQFAVLQPAQAEGPLCHKGHINQAINDAILALKATQYCVGQEFPFTQVSLYEHIEGLRCGPKSSALIDKFMVEYDDKYRMIMTSDPSKTVCKQAALLNFD